MAWSRVSAMKRYACSSPAGPTNLSGIPPERRAGGRAARAQDALVQAVQLFALLRRLQPLLLGRRLIVDQIGLDRVVLLEELRHVHDQVADHRQARQRPHHDRLLQIGQLGDARQPVLAVDVHRIRPAHALAAGAAERERVVLTPSAAPAHRAASGRWARARRRSPACTAWRPCRDRSGRSRIACAYSGEGVKGESVTEYSARSRESAVAHSPSLFTHSLFTSKPSPSARTARPSAASA